MADNPTIPDDPTDILLKMNLPAPKDSPAPEVANFFHFSYAGPEIQMMVGYVDPRIIHDARVNPKMREITPYISHRFALGPVGFAILRQQIEEIGKKYEAIQEAATATLSTRGDTSGTS